ncbi:MAG: sigma 54 modulation/S30EA ribosomal C-terminal domain-containing protein, partial [Christensenellales bacterium]
DYNIVRLKRFPVKPMRVDDAIAQMELLDHAFYLFLNEESDSMCVLYKRYDGTYGLLQPE